MISKLKDDKDNLENNKEILQKKLMGLLIIMIN